MPADKLFEVVHKDWKKKKLFVLEDFLEKLNCSVITVRRRLKKWNAISSYNKNGRYYTLSDIAKFDNNGLWFCQDIGFSKNGNLTQTIIQLEPVAFTPFPEELFSGISLRLRSYSPFQYTLCSSVSNGSLGYLPRVKQDIEEVMKHGLAVRTEHTYLQMIVEENIRLLRKL